MKSRLRQYLAAATVLALPIIAACGEDIMPPPPTGSIVGQVSIEGMGIDGVTVSLSNGASTATAGGGNYRFDNVEQNSYTVTISGFPADASFDATSAPATIGDTGETVTVDFRGTYIRTASVMGTVTVENTGLAGVTVRLSGMADAQTATDASGQYSFTGLRAGTYSVEISGFDADNVGFSSTTGAATVGVGESKVVSFDGTYLRTAGIVGQVSIEGEGLAGVTVSLGGGEDATTTTDAGGRYAFARLKAGDYAVTISGYDTEDYEFQTTSKTVTLGSGETANLPFEGTLLRTAGISGRVSVGGTGLAGVTVSLAGMDDPRKTTTNAQGQYGFAGLAEGDYTVTISGYDAAEYAFEAEQSVSLARSDSKIVNFDGTSLRTAGVAGMVTVEEAGVAGVTVTLIQVTGATSGDVIGFRQTGDDGGYAFGDLLAGIYRAEISGFDAEYAFEATSWQGLVATATVAKADFPGTIIRTASVSGMVTVEGEGMEGVTVSLAGGTDGVAESATTGADGGYMFDGLRRGDYTVTIMNPDAARYSFTVTERKVSVGVGQEQDDVSFAGTMLREGSISGRVHAEGDGIAGATVKLAGAMEATAETDDQGNYVFTGLGPGTYVVSLTNPDEVAYEFESMTMNVTLDNENKKRTVDFAGTHTRTASVKGKAFIDEAAQDKMYTPNEPALEGMKIPLKLQGPGVNDEKDGEVGMDGSYVFDELRKGTYRVLVDLTAEVQTMIEDAGYRFAGDVVGKQLTVAAGGTEDFNLPFHITTQTINVGAVMGNDERTEDAVEGVELGVYPTAEDAEDGTNMLGEAMKTGDDGMATFDFLRADDSGPGGEDTDHLVFVKVMGTGHADLAVSDNDIIEVEYAGIARTHDAPASVRLLNTMVTTQFWIKSVAERGDVTVRDGDMPLGDWAYEYCMDDCGDDGEGWMDGGDDGLHTDTVKASRGRGMVSFTAEVDDLPASVMVRAAEKQSKAMGEKFTTSGVLTHEHDGLVLPADNTAEANDLGPIRITFTTQSLTVGIHRELDDREGFTDHIGVGDGDDRPMGHADKMVKVSLMMLDSRDRPRIYEYDHDADPKTDPVKATMTFPKTTGMVTFKNVPTDDEIIAVVDPPSGIITVPSDRYSMELDVYGDHIPEGGVVVGAFGGMGGARPDVWLCPLTVQPDADAEEDCSTFAYKWKDGKVSGNITGVRLAKTEKAKVKLVPVSSPYSEDLEMEKDVTGKGAEETAFEFTGVADGRYKVMLVAEAGKWSEKETKSFQVEHDESTDDVDDGGGHTSGQDIDATELRFEIRGVVANNADGNTRLSRDETVAGVELTLYKAKKITAKGDDEGNYQTTGSALGTTATDADGLYVFPDIEPGNYIVEAAAGSNYEAVRPRGGSLELGKGGKETDVVNMAFGAATRPSTATPTPVPTAPQWDAANSAFATGNSPSSVSFALLYTNGRLSGDVLDPSANRMHGGATIDVRRCLTISLDANDDGTADDTAHRCTTFDGYERLDVDVLSNGSWSVDDLREGYYEAEIDPPGGYGSVDSVGAVPSPAENGGGSAGAEGTYWVRQSAELTALRPRESTKTFYIARLGAGTDAEFDDLTLTAGVTASGTGGNACAGADMCGTLTFDVGSLRVKADLTGDSDGGKVELWNADASVSPRPKTTKRIATLDDGKVTTISVDRGTTTLYPVVISENGYTKSTGDAQAGAVQRYYDTRLQSILVEWNGGSHSVSRADLEAMDNFLTDEEAGTRDIAGGEAAARNPAVAIKLPKGVEADEALTLTCTAKDPTADPDATPAVPGVTVTCEDVTLAGSEGSGTAEIADGTINTRTYDITFTVAK